MGRFSGPFFPDYRPANLKKLEGGRNKVFSWGFRAFLALAIDVRSRINSSVLFYLPRLLSFHIRTNCLSIQNCEVVCWVLCIARIRYV